MPIIPHPITKIETVYGCIKNFKYIASKLKQKTLPVVSDEGVYHYVIKIYLDRPEIFNDTFPMLGCFHMTKAALRCAGKYLEGCGIPNISRYSCGIVDAFIEEDIWSEDSEYCYDWLTLLSLPGRFNHG